jgi:peptidoglycan/LPS O-acetylase OafA/YrhL
MAWPSLRSGWWLTLVLGVSLPLFRSIKLKWLETTSHHVAKYSYGIYLIHPFCIVIGLELLHPFSLAVRLAGFLISLVSIVVSAYHWLEKPMIDLGARLANRFLAARTTVDAAEVAL